MRSLSLIHAATLALIAFLDPSAGITAQETQDVSPLNQGKPLERELAGGRTHIYRLALDGGQYLHLVVEQRGIDVVVVVLGPDGNKLAEMDSPNGTQGPEVVSIITETAGVYRVEVTSPEKTAAAGRYEINLQELRAATTLDRARVAAESAFQEGERLRLERTKTSLLKSIEKYEEALRLWRTIANQQEEGTTLNNMAFAYEALGEGQKAIELYNQAIPLLRAAKDYYGEASALENAGRVYQYRGEVSRALGYYLQALTAFRAAHDSLREGIALGNIGLVYSDTGENQKAVEHYQQAYQIFRAVGDRREQANTLSNLGRHYDLVGEKQKAIEHYEQALVINRETKNRQLEAITLNLMGMLYNSIGESQKALDVLGQSLALFRDIKDRRGEGVAINNAGMVYAALGERQSALDRYQQALPIWRAIGDPRREAYSLYNVGMIYAEEGERQKALEHFNQALTLSRSVNDRRMAANSQDGAGLVYLALGEKQKALDQFGKALALRRETEDRQGEAGTLTNLGKAYAALGEQQKALDYFLESLALRRAVKDQRGEAATLYEIARVEQGRGNLAEAQAQIAAALNLTESLRTKVAAQELRSSYFARVQDYYALDTDLLMQLHRTQPTRNFNALALQTTERSRARSLLETLTEARAEIRQGVDPALLGRERSLQQLLNAKEQTRIQLLNRKHSSEQAAAAEKELRDIAAEYQEIQAEIRTGSPRYAALTQPQPLTLTEIQQQVLDPDTLLLEYALGEERSYVWAVSRDAIASFELPGRAEIETASRRFYDALVAFNQPSRDANAGKAQIATPNSKTLEAGAQLSRMLLSPVAAQLGTKRLLIVADGALQYIPFATLPKPGAGPASQSARPLIVDHEVVSLPSASSFAALRKELAGRKTAAKALALFADPVFAADDPRLQRAQAQAVSQSEAVSGTRDFEQTLTRSAREAGVADAGLRIPRLPGTRREAAAIVALVPDTERKQALDFDASRAAATNDDLSQYRIIHFATHGLLNSTHPELSGIVLSLVDEQGRPQDGFLRMHEIYNLRLPAELIVLSACQTGLGKEIKGEGLVGLTRGFMYAGAARVMASLWKVDDRATAELMKLFYQGMIKDGLRPAAALRAAQVAMWKQQRWQEPYYWAAFVLQGEWK